jgi:hypothetical protein
VLEAAVTDRGAIHTPTRARQLHDFSGLRIGNITPTDVDGFIDYQHKAFVFFELKFADNELPFGQRLALERVVDAIHRPELRATLLVAEHQHEPDEMVDAAHCRMRSIYYQRKWHVCKDWTLVEMVRRFLRLQPAETFQTVVPEKAATKMIDYSGLGEVVMPFPDIAPSVDAIKW